ncbi:hypothetical protein [Arthrobacter psychrolactophilus]
MPVMIDSLAMDTLAASSSGSFSIQPYFVLVVIAAVMISSFVKAAARKKRARQTSVLPAASVPGRAGVAHQPMAAPYVGTLLNGVPLANYDSSHGHQTAGFANERMRAEAELKRQLDALDTARRAGQVTAEQYAAHREAIFKNF